MVKTVIIESMYLNGGMDKIVCDTVNLITKDRLTFLTDVGLMRNCDIVKYKDKIRHIPLVKKKHIDDKGNYKRYEEIKFEDDPEVLKAMEKPDREFHEREKALVSYLKGHHECSYKKEEAQLNPNINWNIARFEIVDINEIAEDKIAKDRKVHEYNGVVLELYSSKDKTEFYNFAFGLGLNPAYYTNEELYKAMTSIITNNIENFENFYTLNEKELHINIHKGTKMDFDGKPLIEEKNGVYSINGDKIANSFDGLKVYFKQDEKMYEFLKAKVNPVSKEKKNAKVIA